jgi:two-component system response regulator HydG
VLQDREVRPVGEDRPVKVDVRVLCATHRNLERLTAEGRFREDLFHRLKVVQLVIPPLRERTEEIPLLARHFLVRFADRYGTGPLTLTPALLSRLCAHKWPGNVRELENAIEAMVALSQGGVLDPALLPGGADPTASPPLGLRERVDAYERSLIMGALRTASGNRSEAARQLGIGRATLHEKMRKYGLAEDI